MELSLRNMKVLNLDNKQHTPSMLAYYMYHEKKKGIKVLFEHQFRYEL